MCVADERNMTTFFRIEGGSSKNNTVLSTFLQGEEKKLTKLFDDGKIGPEKICYFHIYGVILNPV